VPQAAASAPLVDTWRPETQRILQRLTASFDYHDRHLSAKLLIGDARQTVQQLQIQADAILFDPFSPRRCPQL
jgi:tRNA U34 5-methylaminomethyl-2-thiouridine-forming methyltransferase MnmC